MTTTTTMLDQARQLQKDIVDLRRHLHAHPELSFEEHETAGLLAGKLKELGFEVRTAVGKTGVVADLGAGRTIAIRADMDALPIEEASQVAYRSLNQGVMHACGHDAHMSCALAAARLLAREKLPGRIRVLMQPAEENVDAEGKSGAVRMVEDGAMEGVAAVIGQHIDASIPAGKVGILPGPIMAAADSFQVTVIGKGGHGAYPESTLDSVVLSAQLIQAVQQIVSRRIPAIAPAVVTIGSIHSASVRGNVISDRVTLQGTIRCFSEPVRQKLMEELEKACQIIRALGGDYALEWEPGYPATVNDPGVTEVMRGTAADLLGAENVIAFPLKTWAEDFSVLATAAPGAFMFLGGEIAGDTRSHHSPNFDIDESGLYIGAAILAETARRLLLENPG